jgi:hypothetical protein
MADAAHQLPSPLHALRVCLCRALYPHHGSGVKRLFFASSHSYRRLLTHRSSSPSPSCLSHRRPLPPVLLRPPLLHLEHLLSPWDLYVHFNARLELFSGLPPTTPHRPSTPSWRVPLGEPPAAVCLKSELRSTEAAPKPLPSRPATAGRPNFAGEPPASGGNFPSPVFPRVG